MRDNRNRRPWGIIAERWQVDDRLQLVVHRATGLSRLRGMIGRRIEKAPTAMLFDHCRSVHGIGMLRSLDVVFLDRGGTVISVRRLRPFGLLAERAASQALELPAGGAAQAGIDVGKKIRRKGG